MVNQNSFIFIACRPSGIIAILFWLCIALLLSGDASAANLIQNGDFETGDFINWTYAAYTVSSADARSGTYSAYYDVYVDGGGSSGNSEDNTYFYQSIDLTHVDLITFYYKHNVTFVGGGGLISYVYCDIDRDNSYEWGVSDVAESYTYVEVNTSAISGVHNVEFGSYFGFNQAEFYIDCRFDDIVADGVLPTININTRITHAETPLTSVIINDEDSTGGFPNENGERYLTPNEKASKEYIIDLSGNDLQEGVKLEVSASSAEVTKLTIDISNLVASRNYDVYLDDQWIEKIGEVTEYQYDITSFSLHTLELVYATGEEEDGDGGSGAIEPPIDEDEIIIEDDVITIGELTITKEEFQLLTIEQIEQMDIPQDVKDELIRIKSINVNWWKIVLGLCLMATVVEGSRKEGYEIILVVGIIGVIVAAYKLGYFQL